MGVAAVARHTNSGIAARQRLVIQDNTESREALRRRREAVEEKARVDAVMRELARQQRITDWMKEAHKGRPSAKRIIQSIAREHGFTYEDIVGPSRNRKLVAARYHAVWEVKREYPLISTPRLGRLFGGRDHSTLVWALKVWPKRAKALGIKCEPIQCAK